MTTTTATIAVAKKCDFCGAEADYDFKTSGGPWAYGCEADYKRYRLYSELGTGMGQRLVVSTDG